MRGLLSGIVAIREAFVPVARGAKANRANQTKPTEGARTRRRGVAEYPVDLAGSAAEFAAMVHKR